MNSGCARSREAMPMPTVGSSTAATSPPAKVSALGAWSTRWPTIVMAEWFEVANVPAASSHRCGSFGRFRRIESGRSARISDAVQPADRISAPVAPTIRAASILRRSQRPSSARMASPIGTPNIGNNRAAVSAGQPSACNTATVVAGVSPAAPTIREKCSWSTSARARRSASESRGPTSVASLSRV